MSKLVRQKKMDDVPNLRTTLSVASPDKAAQIRSAVTGALRKDPSGMLCFENTVETTFLLPWDINPQVEPTKVTATVRDQIRAHVMDQSMLAHLEGCGSINWNTVPIWQCQLIGRGGVAGAESKWLDAKPLVQCLEAGYNSAPKERSFVVDLVTYQVDYEQMRLLNTSNQTLFTLRRLAFCPLMPMKTDGGPSSLFHACSLALWGVHDRTSLLREAVEYSLTDAKVQFLLYDRWSQQLDADSGKKEFPQWEAAKRDLLGAPGLHIFALANIIQRPVLVYAHRDSKVGGVYLPLLWKDSHGQCPCQVHPHLRNPIALGYNASTHHFAPLVTFKGPRGPHPLLLPLTSSDKKRLPVFFLRPSEKSDDSLKVLSDLMYVDLIPPETTPPSSTPQTLAAISNAAAMPEVMDTLIKRYQSLFL